jgi:hypothetical protein
MNPSLVLSVRRYSFTDERDASRLVEGVTVQFLDPYALEQTDTRLGVLPMSASAPVDVFDAFLRPTSPPDEPGGVTFPPPGSPTVPGLYELVWAQRPGKGGRAVATLVGARYLGSVDMMKIAESTLKAGKKP